MNSRTQRFLELAMVIVILVLAFALRVYKLPSLMPYTFDQGRDMIEIAKIAHGDLTLIGPTTGIEGFYLGPFYFYLLLPGFIASNGSPVGVAIWNMILVTATLPFAYFLVKNITKSRFLGLTALLVLTFLPGAINQSRIIWNPSIATPVLAMSWWLLFSPKKRAWRIIASFFLYGLSLQTELAYAIFLSPVYGWWLLKQLRWWPYSTQSSRAAISFKTALLAVAAVAITLTPQLLFELKHSFILTQSAVREITDSTKVAPYSQTWASRPKDMAASLSNTLFGHAPYEEVLFILCLLLITSLAGKKLKTEEVFFLLITVLPILGLMLFRGNNGYFFDYYLSPHYLAILVTVCVAVRQIGKRYQSLLAITVLLVTAYSYNHISKVIYSEQVLQYTFQNQVDAYTYARSLSNSQQPTLEVFVPNLRPIQYSYLNTWLAESNGYQEAQINQNLTGDREVILLYEPAFAGGSQLAFDDWYQRMTHNAECGDTREFGIITVKKCLTNE